MRYKNIFLTILLIALISLTAYFLYSRAGDSSTGTDTMQKKPVIAVSIFPWAQVAGAVAGEDAEVKLLMPAGADAHDYEPLPADLVVLEKAEIVLYNGLEIDSWAENATEPLSEEKKINASGYARLLSMEEHPEEQEDAETEEEHEHGEYDPHIWLDLDTVTGVTEELVRRLSVQDPENAASYRSRGQLFIQELEQLRADFSSGLSTCASRTVIVSHDAFGYLEKQFDLEFYPVAGLAPEDEPTLAELAVLTGVMKEKGISSVYLEPTTSRNALNTIVEETNATVYTLDPVERKIGGGELTQDGRYYLETMKLNLSNLKKGLQCNNL